MGTRSVSFVFIVFSFLLFLVSPYSISKAYADDYDYDYSTGDDTSSVSYHFNDPDPYQEENFDDEGRVDLAYSQNYSDYYYTDSYGRPYVDQYGRPYVRRQYRQRQYGQQRSRRQYSRGRGNYAARLPQTIGTSEKVIVVDPRVHAWGAYQDGKLIRAGIATAGNHYCRDIRRGCRTKAGSFRIQSLGSASCKSTRYPLPRGGAPMPYCMYFNGNQALHGSYETAEANISHGCVRLTVSDASWIRFNFANVGTKVIVRPY